MKTVAPGNEQCVTLVIAEFRFHDPDGGSQPVPEQRSVPGILRLSVESEVLIISDPMGTVTTNPIRVFAYKVRRLVLSCVS